MDEDTLSKWFCVKTKEMIDDMHKRKIDMADSSYVINVGGYIGRVLDRKLITLKKREKGVLS